VLLRERGEETDQYRHIAVRQQVETKRQHKVNMSADNYLMQEELGSTFGHPRNPRLHPNTSQAARSASYTVPSTNGQASPWR